MSIACFCIPVWKNALAEYCDYESINQPITILKPFNAGTKQISVVILQLEIKNYLMHWLLSNISITRVSILLQANTLA